MTIYSNKFLVVLRKSEPVCLLAQKILCQFPWQGLGKASGSEVGRPPPVWVAFLWRYRCVSNGSAQPGRQPGCG